LTNNTLQDNTSTTGSMKQLELEMAAKPLHIEQHRTVEKHLATESSEKKSKINVNEEIELQM
jgi:hypothetical protein